LATGKSKDAKKEAKTSQINSKKPLKLVIKVAVPRKRVSSSLIS